MKFPREEELRRLTANTLRLAFGEYLATRDFKHLLVEHGFGTEWASLKNVAELDSLVGDRLGTDVGIVTRFVKYAHEDTKWRRVFASAFTQFATAQGGIPSKLLTPLLESMKKLKWPKAIHDQFAETLADRQNSKQSPALLAAPRRGVPTLSPSVSQKTRSPALPKAKLFIGSSREGLPIAQAIHTNLQRDFECTIWTHGVFGLSKSNIEALETHAHFSDFAVIVVSPDDKTVSRGKRASTPRDNVVFELGLFMGALGRERTFAVQPQGLALKVPSDLFGITFAEYENGRSDGNWDAAAGPACVKIREAAKAAKPRSSASNESAP